MTVDEILSEGLSLVQSSVSEDQDLKAYAVHWINQMLAEAFEAENSIRRWAGEEVLAQPPYLSSLTDEVPYDWRLTRMAFPKAMAARCVQDDTDSSLAMNFKAEYITAINDSMKLETGKVTDIY